MPLFKKESLDLLKQKIDLIEVLSPYVNFTRSGAAYKALCPFHEEKTPSFIIQSGDTHYHCYGCGAHGDAISFLMINQKMGFVEAVRLLAEKFNIELESDNLEREEGLISKSLLKDALDTASRFYNFYLLHAEDGKGALKYLYERGFGLDFINRFQIGLAPWREQLFQKVMKEKSIDRPVLESCGLVKSNGARISDFFSDRIMIPILDVMGRTIGFSARKYKDSSFGPKYINTPETVLFKKSKLLFGLNYSRKRIAKERKVIIVEGQFDALRLIENGFDYTVAAQGTAFGPEQVKELLALGVNRVLLCLDGDLAGEEASLKIGNFFQREAVEVLVVRLGEDLDPDELLIKKGPVYFEGLLKQAKGFLNFLVDKYSKTVDASTPSGKNELVGTIAAIVKDWQQPLLIHESLKELSKLTATPEISFVEESLASAQKLKDNFENINYDHALESDLLRWFLFGSGKEEYFLAIAKKNLMPAFFRCPLCQKLYDRILKSFDDGKKLDLFDLAENIGEEEALFLKEILGKKINFEKAEELFISTIQKILDRRWLEEREAIKNQIHSGMLSQEEAFVLAKKFDDIKKKRPQVIGVCS